MNSNPTGEAQMCVAVALRDPTLLSRQDRAARRARLRKVHLETGVDPRYLELPAGQVMWAVDTTLDRQVHAVALGFTRYLMHYAIGVDQAAAIGAVRRYLAEVAPDVTILKTRAHRPGIEHPEELTFPEQVCRMDMPARPIRAELPA